MKRFSELLRFGWGAFTKHAFTNLLLILELIVSLIALNISASTLEGYYADIRAVKQLGDEVLFVMPSGMLTAGRDDYPDLSQVRGSYSVAEEYMSYPGASVDIDGWVAYNDTAAQHVKLQSGSWDAEAITEGTEVYYPVFVSDESTLRKGDRFDVRIDSHIIRCYVAGVLNDEQRYLRFNSGSSSATTTNTVADASGKLIVFSNSAHFPTDEHTTVYNNKILVFDDISEDDMAYNISILRDQAFVFTMDEMVENSMSNVRTNVAYFTPLVVALFLVSLVGLVCLSIFANYKNIDFYRTAMLCGACRRDCIMIGFFSYLFTALISFIGLLLLYFAASALGITASLGIRLYATNGALTAIVYVIVLLLGSVIPLLFFGKRRSVGLMRNDNAKGVINE